MSAHKHTPGPWNIVHGSIQHANGTIASTWSPRKVSEDREDGESWLDMRRRTEPERDAVAAEQRANARLIAAAPELLEALEPFAHATLTHTGQVIGLTREDFERAIAAIAKATGETA